MANKAFAQYAVFVSGPPTLGFTLGVSYVALDPSGNVQGGGTRGLSIPGQYSDTPQSLRQKVVTAIRADLADPDITVVFVYYPGLI